MKKGIAVIFLVFFIGLSCQKTEDATFCWSCITTQVTSATGIASQTIKTTTSHCDLTEADAKKLQTQLTSTGTSTMGNITATVKTIASCTKKK